MIRVNLNRDLITVQGHADYKDYGQDIVCASVSSIVYTTINGILNINDSAIKVVDEDILSISILSSDDVTYKLIENMIILLEELEKQYPKNIKIIKGE